MQQVDTIDLKDYVKADVAAAGNHVDYLEKYKKNNIYPTEAGITLAVVNGSLDSLKWFNENSTEFTREHATQAVLSGQGHVLKWFINMDVYPESYVISHLIHKRDFDTINKLNESPLFLE